MFCLEQRDVKALVIETSATALTQGRLDYLYPDVVVMTNSVTDPPLLPEADRAHPRCLLISLTCITCSAHRQAPHRCPASARARSAARCSSRRAHSACSADGSHPRIRHPRRAPRAPVAKRVCVCAERKALEALLRPFRMLHDTERQYAVLNKDDPNYQVFLDAIPPDIKVFTYSPEPLTPKQLEKLDELKAEMEASKNPVNPAPETPEMRRKSFAEYTNSKDSPGPDEEPDEDEEPLNLEDKGYVWLERMESTMWESAAVMHVDWLGHGGAGQWQNGIEIKFDTALIGKGHISNVVAAVAAALASMRMGDTLQYPGIVPRRRSWPGVDRVVSEIEASEADGDEPGAPGPEADEPKHARDHVARQARERAEGISWRSDGSDSMMSGVIYAPEGEPAHAAGDDAGAPSDALTVTPYVPFESAFTALNDRQNRARLEEIYMAQTGALSEEKFAQFEAMAAGGDCSDAQKALESDEIDRRSIAGRLGVIDPEEMVPEASEEFEERLAELGQQYVDGDWPGPSEATLRQTAGCHLSDSEGEGDGAEELEELQPVHPTAYPVTRNVRYADETVQFFNWQTVEETLQTLEVRSAVWPQRHLARARAHGLDFMLYRQCCTVKQLDEQCRLPEGQHSFVGRARDAA